MAPSTKPRLARGRVQFGIRGLFVFIFVVAIGAAWVAYERRQSSYELRIAGELTSRGGAVDLAGRFSYEDDEPHEPGSSNPFAVWCRKILSDICGPRIYRIDLIGADEDFDFLPLLSGLRSIRLLMIGWNKATDLTPITELDHLETLYILNTPVQDLSVLGGLTSMQFLSLEGTVVDDIEPLHRLKRLRTLDLDKTRVATLEPIAELTNLRILCIVNTQVRDLKPLADLHELEELSISGTPVRDLSPLAKHNELISLSIDSTSVNDLKPLIGLKKLEYLNIENSRVSAQHIEEFKRAMPYCRVVQ